MKSRCHIYVCLTNETLLEERKAITQAIHQCNCFPVGMDLFTVTNTIQDGWLIAKNAIDDSDFFLLVVSNECGSAEINLDENICYGERLFDYARKTNKPILSLINKDLTELSENQKENNVNNEKILNNIILKAKAGGIIEYWKNNNDLLFVTSSAINRIKHTLLDGPNRESDISYEKTDHLPYRQYNSDENSLDWMITELAALKEANLKLKEDLAALNNEQNRRIANNIISKYSLKQTDCFWSFLAYLHAELEYFGEAHNEISAAVIERQNFLSRPLSSDEFFFLSHFDKSTYWEVITQTALKKKKEYGKLLRENKIKLLNDITVSCNDIDDFYVPDSDKFIELFSSCFFLIYVSPLIVEMGPLRECDFELNQLILKKKKDIIAECNGFICELLEVEYALSENDC